MYGSVGCNTYGKLSKEDRDALMSLLEYLDGPMDRNVDPDIEALRLPDNYRKRYTI
ncbi:MAG: hypothetical protein FWD37_02675 [Methanomassiliicoccaceae archaeon]|nr:hypothetical protein [Methanomassiliicoccaceae archaeon]